MLPDLDPDRDRGERLAAVVEYALTHLTPDQELAVRNCFGLQKNDRLEDIRPGDLHDALRIMSSPHVAELFREFLG